MKSFSFVFLLLINIFAIASDMPFFSNEVIWHIKANLEDNIASDSNKFPEAIYPENIKLKEAIHGAVISAPYEKDQEYNNNYMYVWQRDSSIAMLSALCELNVAIALEDKPSVDRYLHTIVDYISFFNFASKQDGYSPGIAKFYLSGQPVTDWHNPQNDAPAITALLYIEFANLLISQTEPLKINNLVLNRDYVEKYLFDSKGKGLINCNLSYIVDNSREKTYDIWESCFGQMFFTTLVQIKALTAGAALSVKFDNLSIATKYITTAEALTYHAIEHYQVSTYAEEKFKSYCEGLNVPTYLPFPLYPKYKNNDFYKYRGLSIDSSVILAVLIGNLYEYSQPESWVYKALNKDKIIANKFEVIIKNSKDELSPTSLKVIKTVKFIADRVFSEKGLDPYRVNSDQKRGVSLIGRYPGDIYNGKMWNDPLYKGNPWFVTSLALAQYYYTLAYELKKPDYAELGDKEMELIFKYIENEKDSSGKAYMLSEQIDRDTGEQTSARNYTWSYAQYLLTYRAFVKTR